MSYVQSRVIDQPIFDAPTATRASNLNIESIKEDANLFESRTTLTNQRIPFRKSVAKRSDQIPESLQTSAARKQVIPTLHSLQLETNIMLNRIRHFLPFIVTAGAITLASPTSFAQSQHPLSGIKLVPSIASQVPKAIRETGELRILTNVNSAPASYVDKSGAIVGLDVDLGKAVAKVLGLKPVVSAGPLVGAIPALQANRYDVIVAQMAPTKQRAKVLDFVDYFLGGVSVGVLPGNPKHLSMKNLCGITMSVQQGSIEAQELVPGINKVCEADGHKPIEMKNFPDQQGAMLALRSKRVDASMVDLPTLHYILGKTGGIQFLGNVYKKNEGIGTIKGNGMAKPISEAVNHLIADGTYMQILKHWNLTDGAITDAKINHLR